MMNIPRISVLAAGFVVAYHSSAIHDPTKCRLWCIFLLERSFALAKGQFHNGHFESTCYHPLGNVRAILLQTVHRDLGRVHIQHYPLVRIDGLGLWRS